MKSILTKEYPIHFNATIYSALNEFLRKNKTSKVFVLVDTNTLKFCFENFKSQIDNSTELEVIQIEAGEHIKTIETCQYVWKELSNLNADRKSLLINLGGGMVTDLGGFVASTFRRGIKFINVPTTLLGMVDASIGGKNGVDLDSLKNQIGVINFSEMVLIDTSFLKTLPENEIHSGYAEMLKHGLIWNELYWETVSNSLNDKSDSIDELIYESVEIKKTIVEKDVLENNERKTLNYGHTLGHAIESYFLNHTNKDAILHGEAVAVGIVLACYLSMKLHGFPGKKLSVITKTILNTYSKIDLNETDYGAIIELLKFDKKNEFGTINFVLLKDIGKPVINCVVENNLILEAFNYYSEA